jgi:hypothetical protein
MKRTPMKARSAPLPPGKPLARGKALRRTAIVRKASLAAMHKALKVKPKTTVGEFTPKTRKLAYARWDGRCAWDGDWMHPKAFVVQHRRARGAGGSSDPLTVSPANAVAMHSSCHEYVEAHPGEAGIRGFRVAQGTDPRSRSLLIWTGERVYLTDEGGYVAAEPEES